MAKHEQFFALPVGEKQKLDVALTQGKTTKQCAEMLKTDGYFADTTVPTLARALREYRHDTITIHEESRRQAYEKHADPRTRARVRELIDAYEIHAGWKRNITEAEQAHFALVEQMKKAKAVLALSDKVRQSSLSLSKLYADYTKFLLDSGLIPKAPTVHHILAAQIVIKDDRDAGQVLESLISYMTRSDDYHSHLPQAVEGVRRMLEAPKPEPLSENAATVLAGMRAEFVRINAEVAAERRALSTQSPSAQPEPVLEDDEIGVSLDDYEVPIHVEPVRAERMPREHRWQGRTLEGESVPVHDEPRDDDMPELERIW